MCICFIRCYCNHDLCGLCFSGGSVMKDPKTRNSYGSCVNRQMTEKQLKLKAKLERENKLTWREIDKLINEVK